MDASEDKTVFAIRLEPEWADKLQRVAEKNGRLPGPQVKHWTIQRLKRIKED